jgi:hypothetical protein
MSKKPSSWWYVLLAIYTFGAFWALGIAAFPRLASTCFFFPGVASDDCADWVQAFGSIAAIIAGAAALRWQVARQAALARQDAEDEAVRRLRMIWVLLYECRAMMFLVARITPHGTFRGALPMRHAVAALRDIRVLEIPDVDAAIGVTQAIETYDNFVQFAVPLEGKAEHRIEFEGWTERSLDNFLQCERVVRRCLRSRGADIPPKIVPSVIQGVEVPFA